MQTIHWKKLFITVVENISKGLTSKALMKNQNHLTRDIGT